MKKIIICFSILFFIALISASCSDSFDSSKHILFCGYCYENNGSLCISSRVCNVTIHYSNGTYFVQNQTTANNGDGTVTYNISQGNLGDGDYFGILDCGKRSYDDFTFNIYTTPTPTSGGGGGFYFYQTDFERYIQNLTEQQKIEQKDRIPKDFNKYMAFLSGISPDNLGIGKIIISIFFLIIIFSREILLLFKIKPRWIGKW